MTTSRQPACVTTEASTDAELVSLAAAGNDQAFALIMRRHNRLLFRTARSILKNDDDTQDALQEAYLRVWRALASFRSDARLSTCIVWSEKTLDLFLSQPQRMVPGSSMTYDGVSEAQDRADLIAYLKAAASSAQCAKSTRS